MIPREFMEMVLSDAASVIPSNIKILLKQKNSLKSGVKIWTFRFSAKCKISKIASEK